MTASLHNTLIVMVFQAVRVLPAPVRRALDAWSHRTARRRALQRQRKWQQQKNAAAHPATDTPMFHLEPWRD
jgi:DNA-directed RNA polymerase specialized sigma24 family protein